MKQLRQGDVYLECVDKLPNGCRELPRENGAIVLAHGEATGHAHRITNRLAKYWEAPSGERFVTTAARSKLAHEEHGAPTLEAARVYRVKRQVEYAPQALRNVAD